MEIKDAATRVLKCIPNGAFLERIYKLHKCANTCINLRVNVEGFLTSAFVLQFLPQNSSGTPCKQPLL